MAASFQVQAQQLEARYKQEAASAVQVRGCRGTGCCGQVHVLLTGVKWGAWGWVLPCNQPGACVCGRGEVLYPSSAIIAALQMAHTGGGPGIEARCTAGGRGENGPAAGGCPDLSGRGMGGDGLWEGEGGQWGNTRLPRSQWPR